MKHRTQFLFLFLNNVDEEDIELALEIYDKGDTIHLQDFIGSYLKREYLWMSHIGIIEAMEVIVAEASYNGNIPKTVSKLFNENKMRKAIGDQLNHLYEGIDNGERNEYHCLDSSEEDKSYHIDEIIRNYNNGNQ